MPTKGLFIKSAFSDSSLSGPVPLEFDEEDEGFFSRESAGMLEIPGGGGEGTTTTSREASRDGGASAVSIVTPASFEHASALDADVAGMVDRGDLASVGSGG